MQKDIHREITPLAPEDSFLVFDRIKDDFSKEILVFECAYCRPGENPGCPRPL